MTEVLFYHLIDTPLEQALPDLIEKCRARNWSVVVQCGRAERCVALDEHLWTYRDDSFLPHGRALLEDERGEAQDPADHPVWLTTGTDNPINAHVRFLVDGAVPESIVEYERAIYMFDGADPEAVSAARTRWKFEKDAGHDLAYWQQDGGRWVKKA
ncbi:MAG: DNA polymerase III subunit chi [Pseudomonadota bacterium]